MAAAKFVLKSKYVHQIHFYTVHSIILCIHSSTLSRYVVIYTVHSIILCIHSSTLSRYVVRLLNLIMYMKTNK